MSAADFAATYGAGIGAVGFVAGLAVLFWKAGRLADARRVVAEAAAPAMAAQRALGVPVPSMRQAIRQIRAADGDELARQWEIEMTRLREQHPPG